MQKQVDNRAKTLLQVRKHAPASTRPVTRYHNTNGPDARKTGHCDY